MISDRLFPASVSPARKPIRTALTAVGVAAAGLAASAAPATAAHATAPHHARCPNGYVGLTYDDGPDPNSTPRLLEALRAGGARATFFIVGRHADRHPGLLRDEQAAGMWIGNHTYTHPYLPRIGEPAAYKEIAKTQRTIRRITGRTPALFRPPYGEVDDQVRADERRLSLLEVLWTVDSQDWNGASTDEIVQAASTLQPGGIILMHDGGYQTTVDAVPRILSDLARRGLCPGRIAYTPRNISGVGQTFHAVAVAP